MLKEPKVEIEEKKIKMAERYPPGDRWKPLFNSSRDLVFESLTDMLEYIYQEQGNTQFYMDAREGFVYVVETEEKVIEPEPEKKYSLYGEY